MGNRKTLGNIGLGNFCKAILEHRDIKINDTEYHYNMFVDGYMIISLLDNSDMVYPPESLIDIHITDIYNLVYSFEIL